MSLSKPILDLPRFTGDKTLFPFWKMAVNDLASMMSTLSEFALLGFTLSNAEFLAAFGVAFAAIEAPGEEPVGQVQAWKVWDRQTTRYEQQRSQLNSLKLAILASLDQAPHQLLELPGSGVRTRSVQWIMGELTRVYGTMTSADLEAIILTLETPFDGTSSIRELTRLHGHAHMISASNGQVMNEASKVRYLVAALAPSGLFLSCVEFWHLQNPTLQAQTFALLCDAVHTFADNRPATVTSATMGYSANAATKQTDDFEARVAAQVKIEMAKHKAVPFASLYCWSHGPCGHTGADCTKRAAGHKPEATMTNQMGGRAKRLRRA